MGEGNFTCLKAIIETHLSDKPHLASSCIGTELDSYATLLRNHGEKFKQSIDFLYQHGVQVFFEVSATKLHEKQGQFPLGRYRCIHFNFPHDRSNFNARTLPLLIAKFFDSASKIQKSSDRIYMALPKPRLIDRRRFYEGYIYGIFNASAKAGYVLIKKRKFGSDRYLGYQHAKTHSGESASESESAREYIFEKRNITYQEILESKEYGPGGTKRCYQEKTYYLKELPTDSESSDYEESDEDMPQHSFSSNSISSSSCGVASYNHSSSQASISPLSGSFMAASCAVAGSASSDLAPIVYNSLGASLSESLSSFFSSCASSMSFVTSRAFPGVSGKATPAPCLFSSSSSTLSNVSLCSKSKLYSKLTQIKSV